MDNTTMEYSIWRDGWIYGIFLVSPFVVTVVILAVYILCLQRQRQGQNANTHVHDSGRNERNPSQYETCTINRESDLSKGEENDAYDTLQLDQESPGLVGGTEDRTSSENVVNDAYENMRIGRNSAN